MIQAILMGAGLVGQAVGMFGAASTAKKASAEQMRIAQLEGQAEEQRHKQMVLNSRRQQLENVRNAQLARSMAVNSATAQGANMGSGLAGGLGQIAGQERWNSLGMTQNRSIGENIFSINSQISGAKMNIAQLGGQQATWQGISSFGGSLFSAGMNLSGNPFMSGGSGGTQSNPWMQGSPNQIKIAGVDF